MGLLRLLLALSVVFSHAPDEFGTMLVPGYVAVEMFFIISGFYMALILSTRYDPKTPTGIGAFYLARYLRLWPTYAVMVTVFYAWFALIFLFTGHPATRAFDAPLHSMIWRGLIGFSNLSLIGQDISMLFHVTPHGDVVLTFGPAVKLDNGLEPLGAANVIGQAWSIGTEIWFYLMAPFLIRLRWPSLLIVTGASFALRYVLSERYGLATYFFFPTQLGLFVAGMLAYHWRRSMLAGNRKVAFSGLLILVGGCVISPYALPEMDYYKWGLCLLLFVFMPAIFEALKNNTFDRLVGELSYPIYITHAGIISIFSAIYLKLTDAPPSGFLVLFLVISVSILIFLAVESPVDRFRHRLLRGKMRPDSQVTEVKGPVLSVRYDLIES